VAAQLMAPQEGLSSVSKYLKDLRFQINFELEHTGSLTHKAEEEEEDLSHISISKLMISLFPLFFWNTCSGHHTNIKKLDWNKVAYIELLFVWVLFICGERI
jgi:hypothetical protein